ncbi:MAG: HAMP domain-containing histidine kinase [Roseibium sp.]|uniref:sensor histidine kinase n=1 Tax=Roseibium sp. TaxID=1936156 RepID=UPI001B05A813|nr:HAMP domain-containing sensor histidine kinase [Roseibium sp.]MBO6891486.1 HAMP domain-containing histidine kinase [Roseibium sp.]MBO6933183.1 HAMP domain-containing histidine kinase [Roseibium sp.]
MFSVAELTRPIRWLVRSSTLRLTFLLSLIFAIGMAIAILLALSFGREAVMQRVDTSLAGLAAAVASDEVEGDTFSVIIRPLSDLGDLPRKFTKVAERGGGTINLDREFKRAEVWRVQIANDSDGTPILIALPLDDSEDALELLGDTLWATSAVVLFFTLSIGLAAGFWAQRRLRKINTTLDQLASGDLQARTGIERSFDDLDALARQLDRTAVELERLVAQTRHLSASLAHDLRTPLARLRARLEMLPDGEERGAALEEAARLSGIFDTIMRVARIEAAHGTEGFETVDLGELADELADIFGPVVDENGKRFALTCENPATVFADRKMLVQAIANLIQNALVHGGQDVELFASGQEIGVSDNGAGVDTKFFSEITKPMVRLDTARETDGTGLGLALVRAVAERHEADLVLSENNPTGLRVALKFTKM